MATVSTLRANSDPWKRRGETQEESLEALTKLRPFIQVGEAAEPGRRLRHHRARRPGARRRVHAQHRGEARAPAQRRRACCCSTTRIQVARDMYRKTLALRVDPANAPAVSFYRKAGFTTVATVVSKKTGKLRLLMSREL